MIKRSVAACLFLALLLCGCAQTGQEDGTYHTITAEQAKAMMDEQQDYVLLDVRTQAEFDTGYIEGAMLIPDSEIADRAEGELPDKQAVILIYCRSGRRSKLAAQALADLGYESVYEFGGIADWPYGTVS